MHHSKKTEERQYNELVYEGVIGETINHKNVWITGSLDFLIPGTGHYYLGEWESGSGLLVSNIFWPLSPIWGTLAAITDTENVNKRYTLEHYLFGNGKTVIIDIRRDECFRKASEYVQLQKQVGRNEFTKGELYQYLVIQRVSPDYILSLDIEELQTKTNCRILGQKINKTGPETKPDTELNHS